MSEQTDEQPNTTEQAIFAKVELMGHRQRVGRIEEVDRFGAKLLRVHSLDEKGEPRMEDYGGTAIFCVTSITRAVVDAYEARQAESREVERAYEARMNSRLLAAPDDDAPEDRFTEDRFTEDRFTDDRFTDD